MKLSLVAGRDTPIGTKNSNRADNGSDDVRLGVERLFLQYQISLLRYLKRLVGSGEDALDLLQECYARLLKQCDSEAKLTRSYLFTVALNLARDRGRRAVSRSEDSHQPIDGVDLADPAFTPDDDLIWRRGLEQIQAALRELPSRQRKIFLLRRFRNMKPQEIADLFGISKRTVERELLATMEHCRSRIEDLLL